MKKFRFAIMGAGGIAGKFCEAVKELDRKAQTPLEHCEVCAVSSKSQLRAKNFAVKNQIDHFYDSYEEMLEKEKPDCVYIAVTPNDHCRLAMLCIEHKVPVLCEKAMFQNSKEARMVYEAAESNQVFVMEALWSRYLPAIRRVKTWLDDGAIGEKPEMAECSIGFAAPKEKENRYFNPALGGGAAKDITVYAYEIITFLLRQKIQEMSVSAFWGETGVDVAERITIDFEYTLAELKTSFITKMEERMVLYGQKGKILVPFPHFASECFLYDETGELKEHFQDQETENGFVYEIADVMQCVRTGKVQSEVVPWKDTLACAELFDRIEQTRMALRNVTSF